MDTIRTQAQYKQALKELSALIDLDVVGDKIASLSRQIEEYEKNRFKFEVPTAIEAIKFMMEQRGLKQVDVMHCFNGNKSHVSEVLSGKRRLTLRAIKELHKFLKIPLEILLEIDREVNV